MIIGQSALLVASMVLIARRRNSSWCQNVRHLELLSVKLIKLN